MNDLFAQPLNATQYPATPASTDVPARPTEPVMHAALTMDYRHAITRCGIREAYPEYFVNVTFIDSRVTCKSCLDTLRAAGL